MTSVPQTRPPVGMLPWWHMPPPLGLDKLEVWREGDMQTRVISRSKMHPAANVANLWWREPRAQAETSHAIN